MFKADRYDRRITMAKWKLFYWFILRIKTTNVFCLGKCGFNSISPDFCSFFFLGLKFLFSGQPSGLDTSLTSVVGGEIWDRTLNPANNFFVFFHGWITKIGNIINLQRRNAWNNLASVWNNAKACTSGYRMCV